MRQWAISIGINQYQFFQPLSYAQHDAQAMCAFLVGEMGIPADQCLLLTETSPTHWGKSTYPDRETIQSWLERLTQQYLEPDDVLWVFFSGYGICQQGQDYLVPIDGNPAAIQPTTIPLEAVFRSLRGVPTATVLVLLDMNRNESSFSYEMVGNHTTHLASITGIPTILSCQPGQFSRETSALGHGFFTAALLESLRTRRVTTIAALDQYLSAHLPELSEQYWRPVQQAVTICPDEKRQQPLILPLAGSTTASFTTSQSVEHDRDLATLATMQYGASLTANGMALSSAATTSLDVNSDRSFCGSANGNGHGKPDSATAALSTPNGQAAHAHGRSIATAVNTEVYPNHSPYAIANGTANGFTHRVNGLHLHKNGAVANGAVANGVKLGHTIDSAAQNHKNRVAQSAQAAAVYQPHPDSPEGETEIPDALFWRPVVLWGGLVVVGLILGVLLRNHTSFAPKVSSTAQQPATTGARQINGAEPSGTDQTGAGQAGSTGLPTAKTVTPATPAAPKLLLPQSIAPAQGFGVAGASRLNLSKGNVPAQPQPAQPTQPVSLTTVPAVPDQSPLAKARALVSVNSAQASPYWYAIREARTVKPGQPEYAQAQQEIALWSRRILSIARQRGRQGNYDAAIVAARLVPPDQPGYAEAKGAVARWCPLLNSQRNANPAQQWQAFLACPKP